MKIVCLVIAMVTYKLQKTGASVTSSFAMGYLFGYSLLVPTPNVWVTFFVINKTMCKF